MATSTPATSGQFPNFSEEGFSKVAAKRRRLAAFVRLNVVASWALCTVFVISVLYQSANLIFVRFRTHRDISQTSTPVSTGASELLVYIGLAICLLFLIYLFRRRDPQRSLRGLTPASPELETKVVSVLQPIILLTGLKSPPHLYLSLGSGSEYAHSLRISGENYLVMPPEMALALYHHDPVATAVATHEMAHFLQRDCDLFATSFLFLELYTGYSLAANLLIVLLAGGYPVAKYLSVITVIIFVSLFLFANRRLRRVSERSADLFAVLCGKSVGLADALQRGQKEQNPKAFLPRLFGFHPRADKRLRWITKAQALVGDKSDGYDSKQSAYWQFPKALDYGIMILFLLTRGLALSVGSVIGLIALIPLGIYLDKFLR